MQIGRGSSRGFSWLRATVLVNLKPFSFQAQPLSSKTNQSLAVCEYSQRKEETLLLVQRGQQ